MFVDQSQAPLMIKPALGDVTESELHAIMTSGFSSTAGSVLGKHGHELHLCTCYDSAFIDTNKCTSGPS